VLIRAFGPCNETEPWQGGTENYPEGQFSRQTLFPTAGRIATWQKTQLLNRLGRSKTLLLEKIKAHPVKCTSSKSIEPKLDGISDFPLSAATTGMPEDHTCPPSRAGLCSFDRKILFC